VKFTIVALGHKLPGWVQTGFDEYAKRMPAEARVEVVELKPEDRSSKTTEKVLEAERVRIEVALPKQALRVVLDERGEMITTKRLAEWMAGWMNDGDAPCFIIGSADGLSPAFKKTAHKTIALSGCTLPHGLVRVLLVEQLYRAWSLNNNHPYHRE
jgi:23S rRNA (pseudouridine1915-N3)-methyltransferase